MCLDNVVSNSSKISMSVRFRIAVTSDILQNAMGALAAARDHTKTAGTNDGLLRRCVTQSRMLHNIVANIDTRKNLLTRMVLRVQRQTAMTKNVSSMLHRRTELG